MLYLKLNLIHSVFKQRKPKVILIGPSELQYGSKYIDAQLPYLLSNVKGKSPYPTHYTVTIKKKSLGILGYLSPTLIYQNQSAPHSIIEINKELLDLWQLKLKKLNNQYKILLFRGNEQELEQFEQSKLFDLIITGNNNDDELHQILEMKTSTGAFQSVPTKGQGLLRGNIDFESQPKLNVEWLSNAIPDDPQLTKIFENYNEEVKALFFSNLDRMDKQKQVTPFLGEKVCQACHLNQYNSWKSSKHAHAFETLKKVEKHFDPECIQCHVLGLKQKGFLSEELTPEFKNVQCENCHGQGKEHVTNPKNIALPIKPAQQVCQNCHKGSHSPTFDFSKYWPKIQH